MDKDLFRLLEQLAHWLFLLGDSRAYVSKAMGPPQEVGKPGSRRTYVPSYVASLFSGRGVVANIQIGLQPK
jgi:hypothetical protein